VSDAGPDLQAVYMLAPQSLLQLEQELTRVCIGSVTANLPTVCLLLFLGLIQCIAVVSYEAVAVAAGVTTHVNATGVLPAVFADISTPGFIQNTPKLHFGCINELTYINPFGCSHDVHHSRVIGHHASGGCWIQVRRGAGVRL
jgi:hypothetical protein